MNTVNAPQVDESYKILTRVISVFGADWQEDSRTFKTREAAESELRFLLDGRVHLEGAVEQKQTVRTFRKVTFQ